jgi:putative aminopeptidase FrvX
MIIMNSSNIHAHTQPIRKNLLIKKKVVGSCDSVGFVVLELKGVKLRGFIEFGLGGGLSVRVLVVERVWVVFVGMV